MPGAMGSLLPLPERYARRRGIQLHKGGQAAHGTLHARERFKVLLQRMCATHGKGAAPHFSGVLDPGGSARYTRLFPMPARRVPLSAL